MSASRRVDTTFLEWNRWWRRTDFCSDGDIELLDDDPLQCGSEFCVICNELATEQYSWNVDSQNLVTATSTVRVTVSYDCPVYDCPDFDCVIKTCNQGTAAPDFLAHVYCRQTAGLFNMPFGKDYGGTCWPRPHCVRWEPSSPIRGTAAP